MKNSSQILEAIANGDQSKVRDLYNLFGERVYNIALAYVHNTWDAEEITQDVFISIFRKAGTFREKSTVKTWIHRITINTSINYIRKKKRFTFVELTGGASYRPDFDHPGVLMEEKEKYRILSGVIDTLPDAQKTAFILSYIEELPRQEVADIMQISLKAVESLLQRAKKKLREKLGRLYDQKERNDHRF